MKQYPRSCYRRIYPRQKRQHQHVLLPLLVAALLAASAAGLRGWDDDAGTSAWNSDSSWDRGGSQSFTSTRQPGSAGAKAAGDGGVSPPTGPALVGHNGGSGVKNHNKYKQKPKIIGPQPGFSGGFLPKTHRCTNPALPGCQSCTGDSCTACYEDLGDASFELSTETGQCVCPAGYGRIAEADLPDWWVGRRLMQTPDSSSSSNGTGTALVSSSGINMTMMFWNATSEQQQNQEGKEAVMPMAMGVPIPPPAWATDCLPCPVDFYSSGGPVGFAECRVCPAGWTTGNATAAADCLVPYCAPGQEVNRRTGRCRACPFGTYRSGAAANQTCSVCPRSFTTAARGSTSMADCRVPICAPGQQLDIDLFICKECTGNTISPGGVRANGPFQPFCRECPTFTAAVNRTLCLDEACPQPDAFSIVCRQDGIPSCGPGSKPFNLDNFCTAFPVGAQIQWVRAVIELDPTTNVTSYSVNNQNFTIPAVVDCPAGAFGTNVWYPFITSFKSRTNCLCTDKTSCKFVSVGQSSSLSTASFSKFNSTINVTIHDPQLSSLRRMLFSMNRANYTEYGARLGAYCTPGALTSNGLQTSCLGPYLTNFTYAPRPINGFTMMNGTLPAAVQLPGLNHLQQFTCAGCNLQGTFPPDWGTSNNLLALRHIDLGTNAFTGTLPVSWGGLVNLVNLTLSSSAYVGSVPRFWGNMRSLAYANLTFLQVDGTSCMPPEWQVRNGLLPGTTLLTNAGQPFC